MIPLGLLNVALGLIILAEVGILGNTLLALRRIRRRRRMIEFSEKDRMVAANKAFRLFNHIAARERVIKHSGFGDVVEIPSSVHPGWAYQFLVDQRGVLVVKGGLLMASMCIHADTGDDLPLPWHDELVTLILTAKYREEEFLKRGNISWTVPPASRR